MRGPDSKRWDWPAFRRAFSEDYYVPDEIETAIEQASFFNLIHLETVTKLDMIVRKDTPYRRREFERRRPITVVGFSTWIVSKEDLILSKLEWARESRSAMQLADIRSLMAGPYDRSYVVNWVRELGLEEIWGEARNE